MIVNIIEPKQGVLLDCACGSGGIFVQSGDFVNAAGMNANSTMTFYGQEKVEYNAQLCLMNMAVHGLTGVIKSGDEDVLGYPDSAFLQRVDQVDGNEIIGADKDVRKLYHPVDSLFEIPGSTENGSAGKL